MTDRERWSRVYLLAARMCTRIQLEQIERDPDDRALYARTRDVLARMLSEELARVMRGR